MIKVQGCIQSSVEVMQSMNELLNMSEVRHIMNDMAREMARAGLIEETINDAFESVEPEGLEGEAEAEVDRVMEEITAGILAPAGTAPTVAPPEAIAKQTAEEAVGAAEQEMDEEELARMRNRIQAL
ncbi:chmp3, partial [Symbiodinium microadriaticum]